MDSIAIIGIAGLFPGAATPDDFWRVLTERRRTAQDASPATLGGPPAAWYDPARQTADTSYFLRGSYIDHFQFDPHGFRLPADRLAALAPVAQWVLHTARAALEDGGYPAPLARAGLVLGNLSLPTHGSTAVFAPFYRAVLDQALSDALGHALRLPGFSAGDALPHNALSPGYPAAVAAAALGLGAGHFALDAACSSSLYAVALACAMLNTGRADLMLAGAVNAADPLYVNLGFAHLGGLPEAGQDSRPLDRDSGGLIAGEGAGMFLLKRHADALRDGDHIYALIRGVGLANDGAGRHILTPNSKGQVLALRRAYAAAGLPLEAVDYVECHASGTPLGDRTELTTMATVFGELPRRPMIGSVKANVGHLMTAAGMTSMVKLLLALAHGQIPPTPNVTQPLETLDGAFGPAQVLREPMPWSPQDRPRTAGVNAFGFGGVSAHLILSEAHHLPQADAPGPLPEQETRMTNTAQPVRLAITGMDAHFGPLDGLHAFARAHFDAQPAFVPLPPDRWKGVEALPEVLAAAGLPQGQAPQGAYIADFDLDFMQVRIPPNPDDEPIPQQLLLLKVADQAIRDAGLEAGSNVAVLVAIGTELALHRYRQRADMNWQIDAALKQAGIPLDDERAAALRQIVKDSLLSPAQVNHYTSYIGNIAASRVSSLWDFHGPAFTVSAEENSVFKALELAGLMLGAGEVDAVVVGAVDLAGSLENVLLRHKLAPLHQGQPLPGFAEGAAGWLVGEGAGAVVLKRAEAVGEDAYAVVDALALVSETQADDLPGTPRPATVRQAADEALRAANINPDAVGYLELHGSGIAAEDQAEIAGLRQVYRGEALATAVGGVKALVGHTFNASGMASLIAAALAVSGGYLPGVPNWSKPAQPDAWQGTSWWTPTRSRTWFDDRRVAAINSLSRDGSAAHLVLSNQSAKRRDLGYLCGGVPALLPLAIHDAADALAQLDELAARAQAVPLETLADEVFAAYRERQNAPYALALIVKDAAALGREIERARSGVPDALASGADWSTPDGSHFSPRPVGAAGHIAFVYPGAFNSYPKMGYDLFHLAPAALDHLRTVKGDLGEAVAERRLYPRTQEKPGPRQTRQMKADLADDPVATIESGLAFAVIFTRLMRDTFNVQPAAAFGYSLGEGSMMWGMGVWRDGDMGSAAFHANTLFRDRLVGPMQTVRAAWGVPDDVPTDAMWAAYFIAAPVEQVRAAVEAQPKVYLTHVNTPNEVMIAGDPDGCQRVVESLDVEAIKAPFSVVIHNDAMMSEYGEFYRLHDLPTYPVPGVRFYSAADYAPLKLERGVVAAGLARMACKPIDFARLTRQAYAEGARVFLELGPRSTCARWIDETLGDAPHIAASIDQAGVDSRLSLLRLLARLVAHRVPLTLDALYRPLPEADATRRALVRSVRLGGTHIYDAIVNGAAALVDDLPAATPSPTPTASPAALPDALHHVHADFLRARGAALRQMGDLIAAQIDAPTPVAQAAPTEAAAPTLPPVPAPQPVTAPSVAAGRAPFFTYDAIETFALRRIADTYGERYAIYDGRRAPRIPNGDLLLISRVVDIEGERYNLKQPSSIHTEYDVPVDAWFYQDSPYPTMPYSVLMEIALQPCGLLSAYHGPTLAFPETDFYFRNLDGHGTLHHERDMRGRTITNRVTQISSTVLGGTIIQSYDYKLYDGDLLFYEGQATFGYFTLAALNSQAGLDAGQRRARWIDAQRPANVITLDPAQAVGRGYARLPLGQLLLTDTIQAVLDGGDHGLGYAYASTRIQPGDWFFKNHFYQDPVMPGSIGVETMLQAMQGYAIAAGLVDSIDAPHFAQTDGGHKITWKYRGQVLGSVERTHVEAHIKDVRREPGALTLIADGALWRDDLRIYAVTDLALTLRQT